MFCNSFWVALQRPELLLQPFALTVMPYIVPTVHPGRLYLLYPRLSSISHLVTCSNRTTDHYISV